MLVQILGIFLLALGSLWMAALLGLALGVAPLPLMITLTVGYALSAIIITFLGAPIRDRLLRRMGICLNCDSRIGKITHRYGVIGLGLLAPVLTGAPLATVLGLTLSIPPRRLIVWMTAGAALWSAVLMIGALLGFAPLIP